MLGLFCHEMVAMSDFMNMLAAGIIGFQNYSSQSWEFEGVRLI
jgi:hypothetical protein